MREVPIGGCNLEFRENSPNNAGNIPRIEFLKLELASTDVRSYPSPKPLDREKISAWHGVARVETGAFRNTSPSHVFLPCQFYNEGISPLNRATGGPGLLPLVGDELDPPIVIPMAHEGVGRGHGRK